MQRQFVSRRRVAQKSSCFLPRQRSLGTRSFLPRQRSLGTRSFLCAMGKRAKLDPQGTLLKVVTQSTSCSDSELRRILQGREGSGAPSIKRLRAARFDRFDEVMRTIEVETDDGGTWTWPLCQPNLLFAIMASESAHFQQLIRESLRASPCSRERPWNLLVGFDEFVPGNKLQLQPSRKAMNLSFTFLELGSDSVGGWGSIGAAIFAKLFQSVISSSQNLIECPS